MLVRQSCALNLVIGRELSEFARGEEDRSRPMPALKGGGVVRPLLGDRVAIAAEARDLRVRKSVAQRREDQVALDSRGANLVSDGGEVVDVGLLDLHSVLALRDCDRDATVVVALEDEQVRFAVDSVAAQFVAWHDDAVLADRALL